VEALAAWDYPVTYGYHAPVLPATDFGEAAARALRESVAEVAASGGVVTASGEEVVVTGPGAPVTIISRVAGGGAARALLDASAGADLLVVGSRGHGGLAGALLGSVSLHCVLHAGCPVIVMRDSVTGPEGHQS
jgi:nucleotide-binding universal stress UspA family protein